MPIFPAIINLLSLSIPQMGDGLEANAQIYSILQNEQFHDSILTG